MVALVSYMLIAAVLTFGSILWIGNTLQQAVDVGAQEIARMPFEPEAELGLGQIDTEPDSGSVMFDQDFKDQIYDESYLVIPKDALGGQILSDYARDNLPLINRLLIPTYIFDRNYGDGVYRYPGTIVQNENNEPTVLIPVVDYDSNRVTWIAPVEEMRVFIAGIPGTTAGPFNIVSPSGVPPNFVPGTVALRINYPYQSASMSSFGESVGDPPHRGNITNVIGADDTTLMPADSGRYTLEVADNEYVPNEPNIHAGQFGLGRQMALPFENVREFGVRPYRRIISAQAIYRREVFE